MICRVPKRLLNTTIIGHLYYYEYFCPKTVYRKMIEKAFLMGHCRFIKNK